MTSDKLKAQKLFTKGLHQCQYDYRTSTKHKMESVWRTCHWSTQIDENGHGSVGKGVADAKWKKLWWIKNKNQQCEWLGLAIPFWATSSSSCVNIVQSYYLLFIHWQTDAAICSIPLPLGWKSLKAIYQYKVACLLLFLWISWANAPNPDVFMPTNDHALVVFGKHFQL